VALPALGLRGPVALHPASFAEAPAAAAAGGSRSSGSGPRAKVVDGPEFVVAELCVARNGAVVAAGPPSPRTPWRA